MRPPYYYRPRYRDGRARDWGVNSPLTGSASVLGRSWLSYNYTHRFSRDTANPQQKHDKHYGRPDGPEIHGDASAPVLRWQWNHNSSTDLPNIRWGLSCNVARSWSIGGQDTRAAAARGENCHEVIEPSETFYVLSCKQCTSCSHCLLDKHAERGAFQFLCPCKVLVTSHSKRT